MADGGRPSAFGQRRRDDKQRVESFGRRFPDEVEPAAGQPLQLPAAQMPVALVLDQATLAQVCEAVRDGIYHATRRALADAVADFAAEQEAATTAEQD